MPIRKLITLSLIAAFIAVAYYAGRDTITQEQAKSSVEYNNEPILVESSGAARLAQATSADSFAVETDSMRSIRGVVTGIESSGPWGPVASVQTGAGEVAVYTAPEQFLEENGLTLERNQRIEIRGAPLKSSVEEHGLVAYEIIVNGVTVRLRDDLGNPLWEEYQQKQQTLRTE